MNKLNKYQSPINSLPAILAVCLAYLCFWNWSVFHFVFSNGELMGPDDFLRMSQVHAWMQGQGWYDITAYKMVPPIGGDIHWSRLIDVPIAALIYFFDLFLSFEKATYLAAIVWPLLLMLITLAVWTLICDRLLNNYHRWLPAFFGILSISSINQFAAGRIDHHNVQILCFGLMILGLVNRDRKWGNILIGVAIAFSISIGVETLLILLLVLAVVGFEWSTGADKKGQGMMRVGLSLIVASLVLFSINFAPKDYFDVQSDANSFFYLAAFTMVGIAFCLLSLSTTMLQGSGGIKAFFSRLTIGSLMAGGCILLLFIIFPEQVGDPYANVSAEAKLRWLSKVSEAKSLAVVLNDFPFHWLATVGYYLFTLAIGACVLLNRKYRTTKIISLYIILAACIMGTIWQVRFIRTAAFLVIPFCTIFSMMCWDYLKKKYDREKLFKYGFQSGIVMFQISIFWYVAGAVFFPLKISAGQSQVNNLDVSKVVVKRREPNHCLVNSDFDFLKTLPKANVISDLTTSSAVLFHTQHTVVAGPYHRNQRAILDTLDFMGTTEAKAKAVAEKYKLSFLGFCTGKFANSPSDYGPDSVTAKITMGKIPTWLQEVSPQGERFRVFKIRTN